MDVENVSHYVIQTFDNDEENEMILDSNTILICGENGEQTQYVPCAVENGQIVLKKVDDVKRLELYESEENSENPLKEDENFTEEYVSKEKSQKIEKLFSKPTERRKMSYETEFKPCSLPPNRGGMKGLIRYGRKHLIIDQQIMIAPREFKAQLNSTEDLIMKSELAPCTKQQMRHMVTGITRLFAYPAHKMPNSKLLQLYVSNCTSRKQPNEEACTDMDLLPLGYKIEVDTSKIKRITRKRRYPEAEEYLRQQSLIQQEDDSVEQSDMQKLLEAANTASNDHGYTNRVEEVYVEPEFEVSEVKSESEQVYIMQSIDENGAPSNIEVLLAAAAETSDEDDLTMQYQQIQADKEDESEGSYQRLYILQPGTNEVICVPTEYILP